MKVQWKNCDYKSVKIYKRLAGGFVDGAKNSNNNLNILNKDKDSSKTVYAEMDEMDESSDFSLNYSDDEDSKNYVKGMK
jgi:hypothetical protein